MYTTCPWLPHLSLFGASSAWLEDEDGRVKMKKINIEIHEFVWGLHLHKEACNPNVVDVFLEDDVVPPSLEQVQKINNTVVGWEEVKHDVQDEKMVDEEEKVKPNEMIHKSSLKDRGTLENAFKWVAEIWTRKIVNPLVLLIEMITRVYKLKEQMIMEEY
ncbi:hypothetical protein L1887_26036 [Cichorium endivia]|nr:hypothetical protein L1887_26036 [Cichorium endivia]